MASMQGYASDEGFVVADEDFTTAAAPQRLAPMCSKCGVRPGRTFHVWCKECFRSRNDKLSKRSAKQLAAARPAEKRCGRCHVTKPSSCFATARQHSDTLYGYCRPCQQEYQRVQKYGKHGYRHGDFEHMVCAQRGCCALCKFQWGKEKLCVDHCHAGGGIRGLLCRNCNIALGCYETQRADWLSSAFLLRYIETGAAATTLVLMSARAAD